METERTCKGNTSVFSAGEEVHMPCMNGIAVGVAINWELIIVLCNLCSLGIM